MTISDKLVQQLQQHLGNDNTDALVAGIMEGTAPSGEVSLQGMNLLSSMYAILKDVSITYAEYESQLEEFVEMRLQMEKLNSSTHAVLDGLGQGIVFFDSQGICSDIYSKSCLAILESQPSERHIGEVLGLDDNDRKQMQSLIDIVFQDQSTAIPFDELMQLAPHRYVHSGGNIIEINYRPMHDPSGKLTGILLVANDISKEEAAKEEIRLKEARIVRMLRIAKDKMAFVGYLRQIENVLLAPTVKSQKEDFARNLHTIKGMSKFFHLDAITSILHELENVMKAQETVCVEEMRSVCRDAIAALFDEAKGYGREIWGNNFEIQEDVVILPVSYATEFGKELREQGAQGIAFSYFQKIVSQPVRDLLIPFETQLSYFAVMTEKKINITMPASGEIRVFPTVYKEFFESLVHIARNIVDHASEPEGTRLKAGKSPELNVKMDVSYGSFKNTMILTIEDDGKGIDIEKLRKKINATGENEEALLQHIFDPKISTRDSVSEESGRGIGLNAVKAAVEKLDGSINVASKFGKGSVFTLSLPIIWEPR
ncbi:MAG: Hpt domain-containing protein [Alphaproteobacteria bacterium]|nr:Hpt domain-containing protein [Alphaproteobacteria bacterium]